jgi:hypothetical protein
MGMVLAEYLRGRIMRFGLHDRIAPISFFVFEAPFESTRLVFPKGAPPSTMDVLLAFIHFIHASIPFFCCSGVEFFIIFSKSAPEAIYNTMNFFIASFPC